MLQFDENGYLFPYKIHEISVDEMRQVFVDAFPESETRRRLFDNYLDWVFDFQHDVFPYFTQWIDGSFVTQKLNPKDIDFVTFLDCKVYEIKEKWKILERFWSFSNEDKGLDAYLLREFPREHPDFQKIELQKQMWCELYSYNRSAPFKPKLPKGFVQIKFEK